MQRSRPGHTRAAPLNDGIETDGRTVDHEFYVAGRQAIKAAEFRDAPLDCERRIGRNAWLLVKPEGLARHVGEHEVREGAPHIDADAVAGAG